MPVPFTTARSMVLDGLNIAIDTYGTIDAGQTRWQSALINDVIINIDQEIATAICQTGGHPHRVDYLIEVTGLVSFDFIPSSVGPVEVKIVRTDTTLTAGIEAPVDKINRWQADPAGYGGTAIIDGYYAIDGGRLIFTGVTANATRGVVTRGTTSLLISPSEWLHAVVKGSLGYLYSKEGDNAAAGAFYQRQYDIDRAGIPQMKTSVAPIEQYQKAA